MSSRNYKEEELSEFERAQWEKRGQFLAGFLGWYLVMGLIWLLIGTGISSEGGMICNAIIWPANVFFTLVLSLVEESRFVGLGLLAAIALNFLVSLILGMSDNAMCFVPFFIK